VDAVDRPTRFDFLPIKVSNAVFAPIGRQQVPNPPRRRQSVAAWVMASRQIVAAPAEPLPNEGINMSSNIISPPGSATLPIVNFHSHGHRRGAPVSPSTSTSTSNVGSVGQLPVGATSSQFTNMLQSLNQAVRAQSAVSASSAVNPSNNPAGATAAAAGQNQGDLISSLQTLIQQLGANGPANAAASSSLNAGGAVPSSSATNTASGQPSNTALQNILSNLLKDLKTSGVNTFNVAGNNVNAKV
jgi:hypothetical protein